MRKFINFIIALIIIVIIVVLFLPFSMGYWLKSNYEALLNHLITHKNKVIKVTKFDRGWFVSKATIQITLPTKNKPIQLTIQQRIKNGPFLIGKIKGHTSRLLFAKGLVYSKSNNPNFAFQSTTLLHFNNTIETVLNVKKLNLIQNNQRIDVNNATSTIQYSPNAKELSSNTSVSLINLSQNQKIKLRLQNLTSQSNQHKISSLWYGYRNSHVNKVIFYPPHHQAIAINQFASHFSQTKKNKTTNIRIDLHASNISSIDIHLKPVDFQLTIKDINTELLAQFFKQIKKISRSTESLQQKLQQLSIPIVTLISKGLNLNLNNFRIGTTEGNIFLTGKVVFPNQSNTANAATLAGVNAKLNILVPATWLTQYVREWYDNKALKLPDDKTTPKEAAKALVQQWIDNKIVIPKKQNLVAKLTFKNGQLLINGHPFQIQKLKPPQPNPPKTTPSQDDSNKLPNSNDESISQPNLPETTSSQNDSDMLPGVKEEVSGASGLRQE